MALTRRTRSTRMLMVALVTASLVTITVDFRGGQSGPLEIIGRGALSVISPLQEAVSKVLHPVGEFFSTLSHLGSLRAENDQLRTQLQQLLAESGTLLSLQYRVAELEKLLRIKASVDVPSKGATVIAEGVSNFEWKVTIDLGSRDGVKPNMPVVAADGLVGHIVRVGATSSDVQLIIDPRSSVAARLTKSRDTGLLEGQRDHDLRFQLLSPTIDVKPEETVETSGYQNGLYPPGIAIGVVSRVLEDPAALEKTVEVRPYVDFRKIEHVLVLYTR